MTPLRLVTLIVLFVVSTSTARAGSVQELVDAWVARPDLQGVSIGVSVRRVATGESLAVHEGDRLMNPASGAPEAWSRSRSSTHRQGRKTWVWKS